MHVNYYVVQYMCMSVHAGCDSPGYYECPDGTRYDCVCYNKYCFHKLCLEKSTMELL